LDTLVLDSCQKIDVKEFENLKFCNQLSNLNAGFTNLEFEQDPGKLVLFTPRKK
jgi:hypothetical protein